ncbi:MAG: EFR1 family ferrodoxin [Tepidibacter sp.]|jgi:ferredoxin/flavodoxin|uniref:EFR1 family ferrodoxin n=1 Tax=Tepidibacter sp. TaxID=2529387 RepID=UPI0025EE6B2D|nr:EFR1 family ferrodoxin [Tepidibacter sp.]MCT4508554.1 EFR1 family ferrodoxin [Tepidibacter sp.]
MKAAVVYFTGTGNTLRVGEVFKAYLENIGYDVDMVDITKHSSNLKDYDLFIAGTPTQNSVSTFNMNKFIVKYISKNNNPKARFITYTTHSWGTAFGHLTLKDFISVRGFQVVGARAFIAPNNFYMFRKDEPKFEKEKFNQTIRNIYDGVWSLMKSFSNGKIQIDQRSIIRKNLWYIRSILTKYTVFSRFAKMMIKVDSNKCSKCKVCIKQCPNRNILLTDNTIQFSNQCLACARCLHVCPQNAYLLSNKSFEQYKGIQKPIIEFIYNY